MGFLIILYDDDVDHDVRILLGTYLFFRARIYFLLNKSMSMLHVQKRIKYRYPIHLCVLHLIILN